MGWQSNCSVWVDANKGCLWLVWSALGRRYYPSLGLADTLINCKLAVAKAKMIKVDIAAGQFDPTLKSPLAGETN